MIQIDMPMPGCCASCRFRDPDYSFCHADYDGRIIHNKNIREEWCPLKIAVIPDQQKPKPEPKKISALPICGKCQNMSPHLLHEKLMAEDKVISNDLRVICTNAKICMNLVEMKNEEVNAHDQSFPDAYAD